MKLTYRGVDYETDLGYFREVLSQDELLPRLASNDFFGNDSSVDSELWTNLRKRRAKSLNLYRKDGYARSGGRTLVNKVIGPGIRLQVRVPSLRGKGIDREKSDLIENAWKRWCAARNFDMAAQCDFAESQRLVFNTLFWSGDGLIRKIYHAPRLSDGLVPLAFDFLESHQLDDSYNRLATSGSQVRMGIEVDEWGAPLKYWIRPYHPGDIQFGFGVSGHGRGHSSIAVDASEIMHLYVMERPGQTRGVPWFSASLKPLKDLEEYEDAEREKAKTQAKITLIRKLMEMPMELINQLSQGKPAPKLLKVPVGSAALLPPGEDAVPLTPTSPNPNLPGFSQHMLRRIAVDIGVDFQSLSGDFSQTNYSNGRQSLLSVEPYYKLLQLWMIKRYCQPIFEVFLTQAVRSGRLPLDDFELRPWRYFEAARWRPIGSRWVDPKADVGAAILGMCHGLTTMTAELARQGLDPEDLISDMKTERELFRSEDLEWFWKQAYTPDAALSAVLAAGKEDEEKPP